MSTDGRETSNTTYLSDPESPYHDILMAEDSVSKKTSVFTFAKEAVSVETDGNISYNRTDEKSSVTDILDSAGSFQATIEYEEYGEIKNPESVNTSGNLFAYTGHVYEESTGLYYAKARYYDAETGRFLSRDSYPGNRQNPSTLNPYLYASQNPLKYKDPSGHILVNVVAKLGTGALFDMAMQLVANYYFNSKTAGSFQASFDKINWGQVTVSGVQNLFQFKSKALTAAITGLGDVIVNWMKQGKKYSCEKVLRDFAMGFASDLAARYVCKFGAKAVAKGMEKMGIHPAKIKKLTGVDLSGSKTGSKNQYKNTRKTGKVSARACFAAGTQIKTREGSKNIEDIRCGDYVLAEDPETGELAYQEVVQTFVRGTNQTIHVKADGIEIETTREHPFWVEGKGFVNANSLQQGDVLRLATGEKARVESVWEEAKEEKVLVYNLEVAEFHTYFVSELGVLVHNTCNGCGTNIKIKSGKNFKGHFIKHKRLLENVTGKKYPKYKSHGQEFLNDVEKIIDDGTVKYVGKGTLKKGQSAVNIYRGKGITVVIKENGEFVTIIESGKGLDLGIQMVD